MNIAHWIMFFGWWWRVGVVHSQTSSACQDALILYHVVTNQHHTEIARFTDSNYPFQFSLDQSELPAVDENAASNLTLTAALCNTNPPLQSVYFRVVNLTTTTSTTIYNIESPSFSIDGGFFIKPGVYVVSATGFSQDFGQGLEVDLVQVVVHVYHGCERGFVLYDTDHQSVVARFPDVGVHPLGAFVTTDGTTQGVIDLLDPNITNIGLNLVAEFCNPQVTTVTFERNGTGKAISVVHSAPFALGPKHRSKLLPSALLQQSTGGYERFDAIGQNQVDSMTVYLNILPRYQITSFTLVNAKTGTDLATTTVTTKGDGEPSTYSLISDLVIDLEAYPSNSLFSIRANIVGNIQSVFFSFSNGTISPENDHVVNKAPFALLGLSSTGHYNPVPALSVPGFYTLDATPFTGLNMNGNQGPDHALYVTVLSRTRISNVTFVDTTTNTDIVVYSTASTPSILSPEFPPLETQFELDPLLYPANAMFSIRANTAGSVASVFFQLFLFDVETFTDKLVWHYIDNDPPFALAGDSPPGHYVAVPALRSPGNITSLGIPYYDLQATPYSGRNKTGYAGPTELYRIYIRPDFRITNLTLVDATTGKGIDTLPEYNYELVLSKFSATKAFAIRANTIGTVDYIDFSFCLYRNAYDTCNLIHHVANQAPYSLAGFSKKGKYNSIPSLLVPGKYYVIAIPSRERFLGEPFSVEIQVIA